MLLICFIDDVIDDFMIYGCLYVMYVRCYIDYLYWMMYGRHDSVHDTAHDTVHDDINVLMLYWNVFILFLLLLCLDMLF